MNGRIVIFLMLSISFLGCRDNSSSPDATAVNTKDVKAESAPPNEIQNKLDRVLKFTLQNRQLNAIDHGAWQVLHGVLAFQKDFNLLTNDGTSQPAVDYVLNGGALDGWTFRPGTQFSDGTTGLLAVLEPGTKRGQGHADQWLAVLAQCGLPANQPIKVAGRTFTMTDMIKQVQYDVPTNNDQEYSWTLIGLSLYLSTSAKWQASDGEEWSIERLVEIELDQNIKASACGGTHRLIGVAMALNRHLADGGKLEGIWSRADSVIKEYVDLARQLQNPDGSFPPRFFDRPGRSADIASALSATGHILEFLALALPQKELGAKWVERAAVSMCDVFEELEHVSPECGALYHAAHGLVLYRLRRFGPVSYL